MISFILLNYKQKGLVKQCIKGIYQCNISIPFEIIVVDNNSGDSCLETINNTFKGVKTFQMKRNAGFAAGNNAGIKLSSGDFIIIINPDVALTSGSVEKIVEFMKKNLQVGIVGPKLINPDGSIQYSCCKFPRFITPILRRTFLGKFGFGQKIIDDYLMKNWDHNENRKVDSLFGAMLVIRKSALLEVGFFDEQFFLYYEDLDLCRRFWEHGFEVWYYSDAELVHYHQRLSAQKSGFLSLFDKATRIHINSALKYFKKYLKSKKPEISKEALDKDSLMF